MNWTEMLLRLGLAALFGLIIGLEREHHHRPAGIKTHMLVCIGAALVSLIQVSIVDMNIARFHADPALAEIIKSDYGRLGAQVISGIGFLGAGTILHTKSSIKGLTTAATLWLIACVGLAVGMGYYTLSILTVSLTVLMLVILQLVQSAIMKGRGVKKINVLFKTKREAMNFINDYCIFRNIIIKNIELNEEKDELEDETKYLSYQYTLILPRTVSVECVIMDFEMEENILHVSL